MIRSMTGFGTATVENEDYKVSVELKAVNQRFLELAFHMPHPLAPFEDSLRRLVRQTASRGKVDLFINYLDKRERAASIRVDKQLAASYHAALDELSDYLHLARPDDVMQVAAYPDVLQVEKDEELEGFEPLLLEAAGKALKGFDAMRQAEGANIAQDFYRRIESLEASVEKFKALAPAIVQAYRARLGLAAEGAMAVLIMPLLAAVTSGIAFTCDPRDGRDDRLVIHANWGLGETLVGGHSEGDEIVLGEDLAEDSLKLLEYRVGSKAESGWPAPGGGTRTTANAAARAAAPCLDATQALALAELLRIAARALDFAHPNYDAEWVWDGTRFWIVQMRPVTAQALCTYPGLRTQPVIWSRGNTCEVVPDALSPIDWSASRRLVNALLEAGLRLAGFPCHPGAQRGGLLLFDTFLYTTSCISTASAV